MASLLVVGSFRDLRISDQKHPDMQEILWEEGPRLGRASLQLTTLFGGLSSRERKEWRRRLREDRVGLELLRESLTDAAETAEVQSTRVDQFSSILEQVTFQLTEQDPGLLIDETLDRIDRRTRPLGVKRADWQALASTPTDIDPAELKAEFLRWENARLAAGGSPSLWGQPEAQADSPMMLAGLRTTPERPSDGPPPLGYRESDYDDDEPPGREKNRILTVVGWTLFGVGGGLTTAGIILNVFAFGPGLPLITLGVIPLIMGIIWVISTAVEREQDRFGLAPVGG